MKKFLFFTFIFICGFVLPAMANKTVQDVDTKDFFDISDEFTDLHATGAERNNASTRIEASLFRLFKLYRHFEQTFPKDKIEEDLTPEIRRLLPDITDQEVYDYETNIRFVIKNYRAIKNLIAKIKEEMLAPPPQPIEVSLDELKLYNEPYIATEDELVVVHAPMKIVPYAMNKKNFLAVEAAIKRNKTKSQTEKKFDELKNQLSVLELKKIPFYNIVYQDPFTGNIGIGEWVLGDNVKARIIHNQTQIGTKNILKTGLQIYPDENYFIPNQEKQTIKLDIGSSQNIKSFNLFRPFPHRISNETHILPQGGYKGLTLFPIEVILDKSDTAVMVAPKVSFQLCDAKLECKEVELNPQLSIDAGLAKYTSMYNLIEQTFNTLPKEKNEDLELKKSAIYTSADNEEYLKLKFEFDGSEKIFEIYITNLDNIKLDIPRITINGNNLDVIIHPAEKKQKISGTEFEVFAKLNNSYTIRTNIKPDIASIFDAEKPLLSWGILWFAFIGGALLNLMPCVFPVLGLKIISLSKFGASTEQKIKKGFAFTLLGIITAFVILVSVLLILKYTGFVLGWGMQFQSVEFLLFISFVIVIFLLQISGQINLKTPQWVENLLQSKSSQENMVNYLTGLLLVLLSTPCSAPYLGTALGFALSGSYSDIIIIISMVGLGLSLPYWLLLLRPQWGKLIPHPGAWMQLMVYLMNLMLVLTLLWLMSIIAVQTGGVSALRLGIYLLIFACLWCFANLIAKEVNKLKETLYIRQTVCKIVKRIACTLSVLLIIIAFCDIKTSQQTTSNETTYLPISEQQQTKIKEYLRENKVVLIAVEADWCITCKINDLITLNNFKFQNLVEKGDLILLISNQTEYQEETLKFMEKYGRKSLPFYLLYTPKIQNGIVLPELLNEANLYQMIIDGRY